MGASFLMVFVLLAVFLLVTTFSVLLFFTIRPDSKNFLGFTVKEDGGVATTLVPPKWYITYLSLVPMVTAIGLLATIGESPLPRLSVLLVVILFYVAYTLMKRARSL